MRKHIFNAGPGVLPVDVLKQASEAVIDFDGIGQSILEMSHRSKKFDAVIDEAKFIIKEFTKLGDDFEILFLQGGASMQFCMVPYNLLDENETAAYLDTGVWANKALKEAKLFGNVNVVASSKDSSYSFIPKKYEVPGDSKYFHITSNNTIYGTEIFEFPKTGVSTVVDMSSDIFSREMDYQQFDLIYAGAQKNMGTSGCTLVIVNKNILGKVKRKIPSMLDYNVFIKENSLYNTPSVYSIYVSMLTLRWLKNFGGPAAIEKVNFRKQEKLYAEIDRNALFKGTVEKEDRSWMNVNFVMEKPELEDEFLGACKSASCEGLKGHRSVGGFRASLYNALTEASVDVLVGVMKEFERTH